MKPKPARQHERWQRCGTIVFASRCFSRNWRRLEAKKKNDCPSTHFFEKLVGDLVPPTSVAVAVRFYPWFKFYLALFLNVLMYRETKIWAKDICNRTTTLPLVVVQFYPCFKLYLPYFLNKIDKTEPQHYHFCFISTLISATLAFPKLKGA